MPPADSDASHVRAREIADRTDALVARCAGAWDAMTTAWRQDGPDTLWLMYAANYLLRTGGVRWAIDPARLRNLVPSAPDVPAEALESLEFAMLTHNHSDHRDRALLAQLAEMDHIRWLVPTHMLPIAESCGIRAARIIVPEPMNPLTFGPVRITTFDGLHWEYPGRWGVGKPTAGTDATGCLVEWADRRVLFPGDTRTYEATALPDFGSVDTLMSHVWLGRGAALSDCPPALDAFCRFTVDLKPTRRVLLTHLWQVARGPDDYWDADHAALVQARLAALLPEVDIEVPDFWRAVAL